MKNQDLHNRMLSVLEVAISDGSIDEGVLGDLFAVGQRKLGRGAAALSFPNQRETFRNKIAAMRARRGIAPAAPKTKPKPESFAKDWNRGEDGRTPFQTGFAQKKAEDKDDLIQRARLKRTIRGKQLPGEAEHGMGRATDLPIGSSGRRQAIKAAARRASLSRAAEREPIAARVARGLGRTDLLSQAVGRLARRNIGSGEEPRGSGIELGTGGRELAKRVSSRVPRIVKPEDKPEWMIDRDKEAAEATANRPKRRVFSQRARARRGLDPGEQGSHGVEL